MSERRLYEILDFILNHASSRELEAIRAAVRRRDETIGPPGSGGGPMGINVQNLARESAEAMESQIGTTRDEIRKTVSEMARTIIRREAPDLEDETVDELIGEWVAKSGSPGSAASSEEVSGKPAEGPGPDLLRTMIGQFVAYSTGAMTVREEMDLAAEIPDWQKRYWERFPQVVRRLISLLLSGTMETEAFWRGIDEALGT